MQPQKNRRFIWRSLSSGSRNCRANRDIVLYCSCPDEITTARAALLLHREETLSRQTIQTLEQR